MQRIFSLATRLETLGKHLKGGRRGGELKILCSIPLTEYIPFRALTPLRSRLSLAQFGDYIFGSQFAVLHLFHSYSEREAQLRCSGLRT